MSFAHSAPDVYEPCIEERLVETVPLNATLCPAATSPKLMFCPMTLPLTVPVLAGQTLMTLTAGERVVWIVWIWAVVLLQSLIRRRTKGPRLTRVVLT